MRHWTGRGLVSCLGKATAALSFVAISFSVAGAPPAGAETTVATLQGQVIDPGSPWTPATAVTAASTGINPTIANLPSASKVYQFGDGSMLLLGLIKTSSSAAATAGETSFIQQICSGSNADAAVKGLNEGVSTSCATTRDSGQNESVNIVMGSKGSTIIYAVSTGSAPVSSSTLAPIAIRQYQALPSPLLTVVNISIVALILIAIFLIVMIVRTQMRKRKERSEAGVVQYDDGAYEDDKVFVGAGAPVPEDEGPVRRGRALGSAQSQAYVANPPPGLGLYPDFDAPKKSEGPTPLPSFNAPKPGFGHTPDARARMVTATATIQRIEPQAPPRDSGLGGASSLAVGWHVDPAHPHVQNYWDGTSWTNQTQWDGTSWVTSS